MMRMSSLVLAALLVFCSPGAERNTMCPRDKVEGGATDPDSCHLLMINEDGQFVTGFYEVVQFGPKRIGLASDFANSCRQAPHNDRYGLEVGSLVCD